MLTACKWFHPNIKNNPCIWNYVSSFILFWASNGGQHKEWCENCCGLLIKYFFFHPLKLNTQVCTSITSWLLDLKALCQCTETKFHCPYTFRPNCRRRRSAQWNVMMWYIAKKSSEQLFYLMSQFWAWLLIFCHFNTALALAVRIQSLLLPRKPTLQYQETHFSDISCSSESKSDVIEIPSRLSDHMLQIRVWSLNEVSISKGRDINERYRTATLRALVFSKLESFDFI